MKVGDEGVKKGDVFLNETFGFMTQFWLLRLASAQNSASFLDTVDKY